MKIHLSVLALYICATLHSQIAFNDIGIDKNENRYVTGNFDQVIDFGSKNVISSNGDFDAFIGKYDAKGVCQWATKIGGKSNDEARGIYVEPSGNFYVTGYVSGEAKFGSIKRGVAGTKCYIAKYNTSGDPVWIKVSANKLNDNGVAVTGDDAGNIYVAGSFEGSVSFDGQTVSAAGKSDAFVMKISSTGAVAWIKNLGDKEDNYGSSILYAGGKIFCGGSSKTGASDYHGMVYSLSSSSGSINWEKAVGTTKGDINRIATDGTSLFITGLIENANSSETTNLLIGKINITDGSEVWIKKYNSNFGRGVDVVADSKGNIFVTGNFSDSLRMTPAYLNGFTDDIFLAKLTSAGAVVWAKSYGTNKTDAAARLLMLNSAIWFAGSFTDKIVFDKKDLIGRRNSLFVATFDLVKSVFTAATRLAEEDPTFSPDTRISDIGGKLLLGAGNDKSYLSEQPLYIEDDAGNFIKRTITDEHGDFSFKNVDVTNNINLVIEKSEKVKETDEVFLADPNGNIVQKLELNKGFKFKLLPSTLNKMEPIEQEDAVLLLKDFKSSDKNEITLIERLYYGPGSYSIPTDAYSDLNQIAVFMRQNQKVKLLIHSHTDANGDDTSNLLLSDKRAQEIKTYLVKKQIGAERITTKGYGESQIINRCTNDVHCTDYEHSFNRRTEFKFIKGSGF